MIFDGILDRSLNRVCCPVIVLPFSYLLINFLSFGVYAFSNDMGRESVEKILFKLSTNPTRYRRRARKRTYRGSGCEDSP